MNKRDSSIRKAVIPLPKFKAFLAEIEEIASQTDPTDVAITVIERTCDVLDCDRTSFFFVDGDWLDLVIAKGADGIRLPKNSGFAGDCATGGKIVNIADAYQDKRFNRSFDQKSGYRTKQILCVPVLNTTQQVIGVLQAINKKSDVPFNFVDAELLESIASQVAVALRYAQQAEEAQKAQQQRNALVSYIRSMNNATTAASVLFSLNTAVSGLLEADRCTVYIVDSATMSMHIASADASIDIQLPLGKGIAGTVGFTGKPINIEDAYEDERFDQTWDQKTGYRTRSMLVMPVWPETAPSSGRPQLTNQGSGRGTPVEEKTNASFELQKPIAVVQLINKMDERGYFDKDDEELLEVLLRFIAPVLSNSTLFARKQKKAEAHMLRNLQKEMLRQPSMDRLESMASVIEEVAEGSEEEDWTEN